MKWVLRYLCSVKDHTAIIISACIFSVLMTSSMYVIITSTSDYQTRDLKSRLVQLETALTLSLADNYSKPEATLFRDEMRTKVDRLLLICEKP